MVATKSSKLETTGEAPIGLFDSGVGGLTVLRAVREALPTENFVYLGDTARLPYGSKSPETIQRYLDQNIRFLRDRGVKAVIVACNSASSILIPHETTKTASNAFRLSSTYGIPVYNVIEPGASEALNASKSSRIGVIGTRATISGQAYVRALFALNPKAEIFSQASPLLVPLVEEGWHEDPLTNLIAYRYIGPLLSHGIDTLIMGCTHYPAIKACIQRVTGPEVTLIDSAQAIARQLKQDLANDHLVRSNARQGRVQILVTDASTTFRDVARLLLHPYELNDFSQVDL